MAMKQKTRWPKTLWVLRGAALRAINGRNPLISKGRGDAEDRNGENITSDAQGQIHLKRLFLNKKGFQHGAQEST
jgi:hypothetical protein